MDYEAWLHGRYVVAAISATFGKQSYPKSPLSSEQNENSEQNDFEEFQMWASTFNKNFNKKQQSGQA